MIIYGSVESLRPTFASRFQLSFIRLIHLSNAAVSFIIQCIYREKDSFIREQTLKKTKKNIVKMTETAC